MLPSECDVSGCGLQVQWNAELQKRRMASRRIHTELVRIYGEPPRDIPEGIRRHLVQLE
jgi:hypothetical protein